MRSNGFGNVRFAGLPFLISQRLARHFQDNLGIDYAGFKAMPVTAETAGADRQAATCCWDQL